MTDIQNLRVVEVDGAAAPADRAEADVVVVGGGLGGVAAAQAARQAGQSVCLTEETDWLGGQATSQGVTALDDNGLIETSGATRAYQAFRNAVRDDYRRRARLKPAAAADPRFNPGRHWGSLAFEPKVGVRVIDQMLAPFIVAGRLRVLRRCRAYAVGMEGARVTHVDLVDLDSSHCCRVTGNVFVDASELGDLLALGAADFVVGAESRRRTGEPHAADADDPEDVQSFTYSFVVEHCPGGRHVVEKPPQYARNRDEQPFTLVVDYGRGKVLTYGVFEVRPGTPGSFWTYRRIIDAGQFEDAKYACDLALINWSGNDYRDGSILVNEPDQQIAPLRAARDLSLGFLYWLQTEVPRDGGGRGYPEFKLRPDVVDTPHGLTRFPYIRESRRLVALRTILEQEITASDREGPRAAHFDDSIGIGMYGIDLHESKRRRKLIFEPAKYFQVPLGALIPLRTANLLAGCKNIGTTHVTNGCYRLHPVEWAIGEAAGVTAALCVDRRVTPRQVRERTDLLRELQRRLVARGAPIMWYDDVPTADARFERVQMLPFEQPQSLSRLTANLHAP